MRKQEQTLELVTHTHAIKNDSVSNSNVYFVTASGDEWQMESKLFRKQECCGVFFFSHYFCSFGGT